MRYLLIIDKVNQANNHFQQFKAAILCKVLHFVLFLLKNIDTKINFTITDLKMSDERANDLVTQSKKFELTGTEEIDIIRKRFLFQRLK